MTNPTWKRAYPDPKKPGFYWFRVNMAEDPEVLWIYPSSYLKGKHRYLHAQKGIDLGKRFHDISAMPADAFGGMYLVYPGEKRPRPIEHSWEAAGEPEGKKKRARKTSERTEAAQEADPVGTPSDLPPSAT